MNRFSRMFRRFWSSSSWSTSSSASSRPERTGRRSFRPELDALEGRWAPAISLGAAANFGVLGLQQTDIDNRGVVVGDVGISRGGGLTNARRASISGDVEQFTRNQITGNGA